MIPFAELKGKRVLVTRPKRQAKETISRLRRAGAKVIHIPLIEIADPSDNFSSLDRAISRLDKYEWLIFTSQNAVERFFSRLKKSPPSPPFTKGGEGGFRKFSFAAVGSATAAALKKHGIRKVIIPLKNNYSTDGLVAALKRYNFNGKHVLFPCAEKAKEALPAWLKKHGARLDAVQAYRTVMPKKIDRARLKKLIGKIDIALFYSASAERNFQKIVGKEKAKLFIRRPLD